MQSNEMSTEALRGEEERHVFKIITNHMFAAFGLNKFTLSYDLEVLEPPDLI